MYKQIIVVLGLFLVTQMTHSASANQKQVRSIRLDPGYLYLPEYGIGKAEPENRKKVIDKLISEFKRQRMNRVYLLLNNPEYGSLFRSNLTYQRTEPTIGKSPFLEELIERLKKEKIEAFAFFYILRSKDAWIGNESWRFNCPSGKEQDSAYLLDVANPDATSWYRSMVLEAMAAFPDLAGVDMAEPETSTFCTRDNQREKSKFLVNFLKSLSGILKKNGKKVILTAHIPSHSNGVLWSNDEMLAFLGFDLVEIIKNVPMDAFYPEIIFQDWKGIGMVKPEWTGAAAKEIQNRILFAKNLRYGVHFELGSKVTEQVRDPLSYAEIKRGIDSVYKARLKNFDGVDYYSVDLALKVKELLP